MLRDEIKRFESYEDLASAAEMWWSRYGKPEYCGSYIESRRKTYTYPIFASFHLSEMDGEVCGIGVRALNQPEFEQLFKLYPIGGKHNEMREEFEKLPEIAKNIDKYIFCETDNEYKELDVRYALGRIKINGAWYAYQEQQKKIDSMLDRVCGKYEDFK